MDEKEAIERLQNLKKQAKPGSASANAAKIAAIRGRGTPRTRTTSYSLGGTDMYTNLPRGRAIMESDQTSGVNINGGTIERPPKKEDGEGEK